MHSSLELGVFLEEATSSSIQQSKQRPFSNYVYSNGLSRASVTRRIGNYKLKQPENIPKRYNELFYLGLKKGIDLRVRSEIGYRSFGQV